MQSRQHDQSSRPVSRSAAERTPAQRVAKPNLTSLPDKLKAGVEALSGQSLDHVRVHRNSAKPSQLQAHAFAQGSDIHLAPGQEKHLPHEAWHVVQQAQGRVRPTVQLKAGVPVNDDSALEREADTMGARANHAGASLTAQPTTAAPDSHPTVAPAQLARDHFGGNPRGRGGKGKKFNPGQGKGSKGRGLDRGSSEAARRQQQGRNEAYQQRQAALRARLEQRQHDALQNLVHRAQATPTLATTTTTTTATEPSDRSREAQNDDDDDSTHESSSQASSSSSSSAENQAQIAAEANVALYCRQLELLSRTLLANSHAVNAYRYEGAPYAMQFAARAQKLATQGQALLEGDEFSTVRERNAFYKPAKELIAELDAMVGTDPLKKLINGQRVAEAHSAAEEKKSEALARSRAGHSEAAARAQAAIRAEANAYLAEMRAKYRQYRNDTTGTVNRGAYYQHPNGAPPASRVTISPQAMALVQAEATSSGFTFHGSLTSNVAFHRTVPDGRPPFIFHV